MSAFKTREEDGGVAYSGKRLTLNGPADMQQYELELADGRKVGVRLIGCTDLKSAKKVVLLLHGAPGSAVFFMKGGEDWLRLGAHGICGV